MDVIEDRDNSDVVNMDPVDAQQIMVGIDDAVAMYRSGTYSHHDIITLFDASVLSSWRVIDSAENNLS